MGGEPRFALNLVFFPDDAAAARGARRDPRRRRARVRARRASPSSAVTRVRDPEVKFGLVGHRRCRRPASCGRNRTAHAGPGARADEGARHRRDRPGDQEGRRVARGRRAPRSRSMTTLNQSAARSATRHGVTSATDVTGFGLLGHLRNIVRGSQRRRAHRARDAAAAARARSITCARSSAPAAARRTARMSRPIRAGPTARRSPPKAMTAERELLASLACDAQTSGGLLCCVHARRADALRRASCAMPACRRRSSA